MNRTCFTLPLLVAAACSGPATPATSQRSTTVPTDLFVDAHGSATADGTHFNTLTAAVAAARALPAGVTIHVLPGTYDHESLPIEIDFPGLQILGSTRFHRDHDRRLPDTIVSGTETRIATPDPPPPDVFEIRADDVTLAGLAFGNIPFTSLVLIDGHAMPTGIRGFQVRGNWIENTLPFGFGVETHYASGTIEANYMTQHHAGSLIFAGSDANPAQVLWTGNRETLSEYGACVISSGDGSGPTKLILEASNNDASGVAHRSLFGLPHFGAGIQFLPDTSGGQPSTLVANVHDNWFGGNTYGIEVDPFATNDACPPPSTLDFHGTFARNDLRGDDRNRAFLGATFWARSLDPINNNFLCYYPSMHIDVTDSDGEIGNCVDYDNPDINPDTGTPLGATIRVNGQAYSGISVSPVDPGSPCNR
jgi:hypothetical protein